MYFTGLRLAKGLILTNTNLSNQKETIYREDWEFTQMKGIFRAGNLQSGWSRLITILLYPKITHALISADTTSGWQSDKPSK